MMYCTGGIRCEFFSARLKAQGFQKVYKLQGGIQHYGNVMAPSGGTSSGEGVGASSGEGEGIERGVVSNEEPSSMRGEVASGVISSDEVASGEVTSEAADSAW